MFLHSMFQVPNLIQTGFLSIIKQKNLINEQNINQTYYEKRTALHIAVICNQVEIVEFLLKLNPDLNARDSLALRPIDWITLKKNPQTFQPLLKYLAQNVDKIQKQPEIQLASINIWRAAEIGLTYLEPFFTKDKENKQQKIGNPFSKDAMDRKAIHYAAISGNVETFNFLLEHKFDPLQVDNFGFNCYHYININLHNLLNKTLLKRYSNLNFQIKENHYDVIVIGSGAAGIGTGVTLSRNGVNYLVLEARDRIGGRMVSTNVSDIEMDLGACWVHSYSKNNPICKEVNQLKWKSRKSSNKNDVQIVTEMKHNIPQKDIHSSIILSQTYYAIVQQKALQSKVDISIQEAGKQYYQKNIVTLPVERKALVDMFINMKEHYNAASIAQLSAKYFEEQVDVGDNFAPQGSYSKLMNAIASSVGLEKNVNFNVVVEEINYQKEKQYCEVKTKDGTVFYGKKIVSSLPLGILKANRVKFTPQLPESHQQCIKKLGWGVMNKVIVSFEKPFWKQNAAWIRIACEQKGKFPAMFNFSTQDKHILCCFVTGEYATSISGQKDEEILESFLELIRKTFKREQVKVLDYTITRWDKDQHAMGSYTYFAIDSNMETSRKLRQNINQKLWFVGEHCYAEHIGCAHGAFQTGIWAVEEILTSFKRIDDK